MKATRAIVAHRRRRAGIALLALVASACDVTAPLPTDAEEFAPPAVYARWWGMTEACAGRSRPMSSVTWYRVPGRHSFYFGGREASGSFDSRRNAILIAGAFLDDGALVRHEMLHALLRRDGHPLEYYAGSCAGLVSCSDCDAWRPPLNWIAMPAESLRVESNAELLPREADGQRFVALEIMVTNDRGVAVVLAGSRYISPDSWGYRIGTPDGYRQGGEIAGDSSVLHFAPFATKRWRYEFRVNSAIARTGITPGRRALQGGYGRKFATWDTIEVLP